MWLTGRRGCLLFRRSPHDQLRCHHPANNFSFVDRASLTCLPSVSCTAVKTTSCPARIRRILSMAGMMAPRSMSFWRRSSISMFVGMLRSGIKTTSFSAGRVTMREQLSQLELFAQGAGSRATRRLGAPPPTPCPPHPAAPRPPSATTPSTAAATPVAPPPPSAPAPGCNRETR